MSKKIKENISGNDGNKAVILDFDSASTPPLVSLSLTQNDSLSSISSKRMPPTKSAT